MMTHRVSACLRRRPEFIPRIYVQTKHTPIINNQNLEVVVWCMLVIFILASRNEGSL